LGSFRDYIRILLKDIYEIKRVKRNLLIAMLINGLYNMEYICSAVFS
jgi:hypothetical protein